jgi:aminoglycoside phosphotransferase (APT) family kinase protein
VTDAGPRPMPAAEVDLTPGLVRRLLAAQQPGLAGLPLAVMANGWDNMICRLGAGLLIRLPRRAQAAGLVVHEQRWLPVLAPRLPLPVPAPVRAGRPGPGYPWPWSVVPFLPGPAAARQPPASPPDAAASLAAFLAALHVPAAPGAPANPVRGIPLAGRAATLAGNLRLLGDAVDQAGVRAAWEAAVAAPVWEGQPVWVHGDLHPANILVSRGRISAVIDFGDLTAGDPATDLSVAWMLLPAGCRATFRDAYQAAGGPPISAATWARARGWALSLAISFLAHSADNPLIAGIGHRTLAAVLGDPGSP